MTGVLLALAHPASAGAGRSSPTPELRQVNLAPGGAPANAPAGGEVAVSGDGRYVAFESDATTLVSGDTNQTEDVFVRDMVSGLTERVSVASGGGQILDGGTHPTISHDGRYVAFRSWDRDARVSNVLVHDRLLGATEDASVGSAGDPGDGSSFWPRISGDGRHVVFQSEATNLVDGDTNGISDVFVRDLDRGRTQRVSVRGDGTQGRGSTGGPVDVSDDGRFVAFFSHSRLVRRQPMGLFVFDTQQRRVRIAAPGRDGRNVRAGCPQLSDDGRRLALATHAALVRGDRNEKVDVFVHHLRTGRVRLVSRSQKDDVVALGVSGCPRLSGNGRWVVFKSRAAGLVPGDTNRLTDLFVRDLVRGTTERVSLDSSGQQNPAPATQVGGASGWGFDVSRGGRFLAWVAHGTGWTPTDTVAWDDAFWQDRRLS
jgi:Tol biopolymer transport system component